MILVVVEYCGVLENGLDVQVGLCYDDNKVFDDFISWNFGLLWQVLDWFFWLYISVGVGLVNLFYYEFYVDDSFIVGNFGLKFEQNCSVDLGFEY